MVDEWVDVLSDSQKWKKDEFNGFKHDLDTQLKTTLKSDWRWCSYETCLGTSGAENPVVTKKDIVKAISESIGETQLKTKEIVQKTFEAIVDTLVEERRIELRNFGVFEVKKRAARKARNPRTGARVDVAEKYVVTFKPGKDMEERVRLLEIAEQQKSDAIAQQGQSPSDAANPTNDTSVWFAGCELLNFDWINPDRKSVV